MKGKAFHDTFMQGISKAAMRDQALGEMPGVFKWKQTLAPALLKLSVSSGSTRIKDCK